MLTSILYEGALSPPPSDWVRARTRQGSHCRFALSTAPLRRWTSILEHIRNIGLLHWLIPTEYIHQYTSQCSLSNPSMATYLVVDSTDAPFAAALDPAHLMASPTSGSFLPAPLDRLRQLQPCRLSSDPSASSRSHAAPSMSSRLPLDLSAPRIEI